MKQYLHEISRVFRTSLTLCGSCLYRLNHLCESKNTPAGFPATLLIRVSNTYNFIRNKFYEAISFKKNNSYYCFLLKITSLRNYSFCKAENSLTLGKVFIHDGTNRIGNSHYIFPTKIILSTEDSISIFQSWNIIISAIRNDSIVKHTLFYGQFNIGRWMDGLRVLNK